MTCLEIHVNGARNFALEGSEGSDERAQNGEKNPSANSI